MAMRGTSQTGARMHFQTVSRHCLLYDNHPVKAREAREKGKGRPGRLGNPRKDRWIEMVAILLIISVSIYLVDHRSLWHAQHQQKACSS